MGYRLILWFLCVTSVLFQDDTIPTQQKKAAYSVCFKLKMNLISLILAYRLSTMLGSTLLFVTFRVIFTLNSSWCKVAARQLAIISQYNKALLSFNFLCNNEISNIVGSLKHLDLYDRRTEGIYMQCPRVFILSHFRFKGIKNEISLIAMIYIWSCLKPVRYCTSKSFLYLSPQCGVLGMYEHT